MLPKRYATRKYKVYGNNPEDIEGYDDAVSSTELYICNHVLEWKYTAEELKKLNRYDKVDASELIWIPKSIHQGNKYIHKSVIMGQEGQKNHFYGKHHSSEHKERMRLMNTGKNNPNYGKHWQVIDGKRVLR